ncbi:uncharacterized protein K02A2.6-like [Eupeodes corollae]|uniref:uncharacterized protein K02A2.6-like n=1 Tax=Eupeodes corollae TaxID=290404 RepID=UPI002490993C|nr:uncharacterized protein K02A2.6-like [Eupeodes corollae]
MLTKLDSEGSTITLDILSRECQRLINLKTDTALIENAKTDAVVNRLHTTNSSSNKSKAIPKSPCWFCGNMHFARDCSYTKHKCGQCNNIGHKEGYCNAGKKKKNQTHKNNRPKAKTNLNNNKTFRPELKSIFITNKIEPSQRKYVSVNINGTNIDLQLDTASDITIISEKIFKNINVPRVDKVPHTARSATGKLPLSAQFDCNVKFRTRQAYSTCYVTPIKNLNVMGLDWIKALNLEEMSISAICNQVTSEAENKKSPNESIQKNISLLKLSFPDVFNDSLGLCNKTKAHLVTMPNIQPVFRPKRPVAYAVKDLVEAELQRLQDTNVISPVNYSEWAAPIVVIRKSNGSIRICADFSTGLNNVLESHQYPLPLPEDIFARLANARFFSHIDLSDAFLQIEVDEESKHLLTINTHMGLFRYNRMVFGVKTFPSIFQQVMDQMLAGLSGAAAYIDDIFVSGTDLEEHNRNLHEVLCRIQDYGFKIKFAKCRFFVNEVKYLGYVINQHGLHPDPERILAINNMPEPTNVSELRSFLGAINFYGKFVDDMRHLRGPLDELLKANTRWVWTKEHHNSFLNLKKILSSDLVLAHYDPKQNIIVAADASNYGLGACIMHEYQDGTIKAICHASRSLTPTEKAYSQIEKEGLALVFAVTKFHKMVFGRKFKLHTDHKPLLAIFGKKTGIAVHQANRLQRWAVKLLAYDFDISFISTSSFGYADVLSRLIDKNIQVAEDFVIASIKIEQDVKQILADNLGNLPVTHQMVKFESAKDIILRQIFHFVANGWPNEIKENGELKAFFNRRENISIIDGCIMFGQRVVVPKLYRRRVLKQLHRGHQGIERTKSIARSFVYWPSIDADIKILIQNCNNCASAAKMPTKTLLQPWPTPTEPWERLHLDYAGPIEGNYFLVLVDALSKWPEIVVTKSITTQRTLEILSEIFSRFGLPKTIVSDNGTQFKSSQFQQYMAENGIQHLCSSPYNPMSNGQAERFVDTFKRSLLKLNTEGTITQNLQTFLQSYRSTPNRNSPNSKSPAEIMFGRNIRISLNLIKPNLNENHQNQNETINDKNQTTMSKQFNRKFGTKSISFNSQDLVYVSIHTNNNNFQWQPGQIIERFGKVMYNVLMQSGRLIRAHANQLRIRHKKDITAKPRVDKPWDMALDVYECDTTPCELVPPSDSDNSSNVRTSPNKILPAVPFVPRRTQRTRRPINRFVPG